MNIPVIIPVYNAAGSIEQCLDSVLAQTYKVNYQVITVNDGSINDSFFSYSAIKQKSNRGTPRNPFSTTLHRGNHYRAGRISHYQMSFQYLRLGAIPTISSRLKTGSKTNCIS